MCKEIKIINQQEILGKDFKVYGTIDEPLFLAKDVSEWIEHSRASEMIKTIDEDEKLMQTIFASGQNREMWFLTENGLYEVLFQSRKPIAKKFKKEVKKVLKQIRQTGGYIPTNEQDSEEDILAKAVLIAQKTIERKNAIIEKQNKQLIEQEPLVGFANQIGNSADSIEVGVFAKLVKDENIKIGRNRLFQWFRDNKYLMKDNTPYQSKIEQGLFEVTEYTYNTPYKQNCIGRKTTITGKGQIYFVEKLRKEFC